jgi:hypothetical protein
MIALKWSQFIFTWPDSICEIVTLEMPQTWFFLRHAQPDPDIDQALSKLPAKFPFFFLCELILSCHKYCTSQYQFLIPLSI